MTEEKNVLSAKNFLQRLSAEINSYNADCDSDSLEKENKPRKKRKHNHISTSKDDKLSRSYDFMEIIELRTYRIKDTGINKFLKIKIPHDKYPDVNFHGAIFGINGNNIHRVARNTGTFLQILESNGSFIINRKKYKVPTYLHISSIGQENIVDENIYKAKMYYAELFINLIRPYLTI